MTAQFKDYYRILGVPRNADADEIKRAFRRLAREHHPDVARNPAGAEGRFKEINEAYEVLGDPDRRRRYDAMASAGPTATGHGPSDGSRGGPGRAGPGFDGDDPFEFRFGGTGFSDFFERFFGHRARRRPDASPDPDADLDPEPDVESDAAAGDNASATDGTSTRSRRANPRSSRRRRGREARVLVTFEEALRGALRSVTIRRTDHRTGQTTERTVQVRLPPGLRDGQLIRVAGQGTEPQRGAPPEDLYLRVRLATHPDFRRRGSDLYYDLEADPWDAVLGAAVQVPTVEGPVTVRIPAGSGSGRKLRLPGRGLPSGRRGERGDLFIVIAIRAPANLTARERELWEELARNARG
jgi:curved DNA-binding protein